jgi:hypothetical protein
MTTSSPPTIRDIINKYESESVSIRGQMQAHEEALAGLHARLQEIQVVMEALVLANRANGLLAASHQEVPRAAAAGAAPVAAAAPPAPAAPAAKSPEAPAPRPTPPAVAATVPERRTRRTTGSRSRTTTATGSRKGRRKAMPSETNDINDLSIVEASIELARRKGVQEADAGLIHQWFTEENYLGRSGEPPNRNSIFVSLNREYNDAMKRGDDELRVERPQRGLFRFNFDL